MLETIAQYEDGAGLWRGTREGTTFTIHHPNDGPQRYKLTRAPGLDAQYWPEFGIADRLAACDDWGPDGVVWIDGEGYFLEGVPQ